MQACLAYTACMKKNIKQYTVRGITKELDQLLKTIAKKRGESLNSLILVTLMQYANLSSEKRKFTDLNFLCGKWQEDKETEKALREQRKIDKDMWK
jgi:hypothetical protein